MEDQIQKWEIKGFHDEGVFEIEQLESLWKQRQIDSFTQIRKENQVEWKHIIEDVDLLNKFVDLNEDQQTQQESKVDEAIQSQIRLKTLVKKYDSIKEIEQTEQLNEGDKLQLKKLFRNKRKTEKQKIKKKEEKQKSRLNTSIYVRGLPEDITFEQLKEFFGRAGVIKNNIEGGDVKIKIYKNEEQKVKGDCLVNYVKRESVELAIEMLNDREIRQGQKVVIEEAQFREGREVGISKKVIDKKQQKILNIRQKTLQQQLFSWDEEDRGDGLQIIIMSNVFELEEVEDEVEFQELYQDIHQECQKIGGVQRIQIFRSNPQGIVMIKFKESKHAKECIELMNGRYFGGKQIESYYYDGVTNYNKVLIEDQERIDAFGDWLETEQKESDQQSE